MYYKHIVFTFIILLSGINVQAQTDVEKLFDKFKVASNFDRTYPREKVYLHLDNSSYIEGDSIFYKAYVVRASSLLPTTLSHVLYVDLLNADGQLMEKQTLQLDDMGQADGCFSLKLPVRAGYYEVRAYTREMTNWGTEACFSRVIPVFTDNNPNEKKEHTINTDIMQLSLPEPEVNKKVSMAAPRPYRMTDNKRRTLTFFPEGGWRAKDLEQRIAYKLTDGRGQYTTDTVNVYDKDGNLVLSTQPLYNGMGMFTLPATFGEGYACVAGSSLSTSVSKLKYNLPEPSANFALTANYCKEGVLVDIATAAPVAANQLLGLAVINREKTCYFDTLTVGTEGVELLIPQKALRGGVNRIELFDTEGHSMASRMVWAQPSATESRTITTRIRQNKAVYDAFSPAVIDIELTDAQSRPVKTTFSLAVRDHAGNLTETNDGGIGADLLLSSELKGYIHRPDLYFVKNDALHQRMLDMLLLVQGWTADSFATMCGTDTFKLLQPIEDKLILRGTLYKMDTKLRPQPNFTLDFKAYSLNGGCIEGETVTDEKGRFAFESNVNYCGDYIAQFIMKNDNNKRRWSKLTLDRWFAPQPRPLYANDLMLRMPTPIDSALVSTIERNADTFTWKDTLSYSVNHTLGTAEVKAHKRYKGFTGNRYTWNGGEKHGMENATKYYNIEWAVEELKDRGHDCSENVISTLGYMENALESSQYVRISLDDEQEGNYDSREDSNQKKESGGETTPNIVGTDSKRKLKGAEKDLNDWLNSITYKGIQVRHIYFDNTLINNGDQDFFNQAHKQNFQESTSEEIKSVAIVGSCLREDAITGQDKRNSRTSYSMYIYSLPESYRFRENRGIDRRRIQGFAPHKAFYSPNYSDTDLPNDKDVRRTLYWNPSVRTNDEGRANVLFFTNSRPQQMLDITVRGITKEGGLIE